MRQTEDPALRGTHPTRASPNAIGCRPVECTISIKGFAGDAANLWRKPHSSVAAAAIECPGAPEAVKIPSKNSMIDQLSGI